MNGRPALRVAARQKSGGFTYLGILFAVAVIGMGLAVTGQVWSMSARRAAEQELLYVGDSYRRAIMSYYRSGPGRQYPKSLEDLVLDTRTAVPIRHLRKIYADPITQQYDWELLTQNDGTITGVASRSQKTPIKRANFDRPYAEFEDAECYCDWKFQFLPPYELRKRRQQQ